MTQPAPFEIAAAGAQQVASNGRATLSLLEDVAQCAVLKRRRAQKGLSLKPAGELAIPMLNELAGQVLADMSMPAHTIAERLQAIMAAVQPVPPRNVEWAVAELDGLRVYFDGENVIVTRQDIWP